LKRIRNNQRGDTLVEVAIAAAILSGVVASVFVTTNVAYRLEVSSRQHTESTILLQQQLEMIQNVRDQYIRSTPRDSPGAGWLAFRTSIFGSSTPSCSTSRANITMRDNKNDTNHTDTWTLGAGSKSLVGANADYTIVVEACYPAAGVYDKIRFTAKSNWEGPGSVPQYNDAVVELVDIGDIEGRAGL
jgi:Tfp pilus assembly protein PilV